MPRQRGAILVVVLAALAILAYLGVHASRFAAARHEAFHVLWCVELERGRATGRVGGDAGAVRATIGGGADGAPTFEGFHGSQAFSPGRNGGVGHGVDCQRVRKGGFRG
ncbi:hypothetical protein KPL74_07405 [Bacillus sp. NP157]|nr:hypothetical protein KPL74_07405 [Bacillus sp. NP157]